MPMARTTSTKLNAVLSRERLKTPVLFWEERERIRR
jgi:hypothetical protein